MVYFKNRTTKGWASGDENIPGKSLPDDVKAGIRRRIIPILAASQPQIRAQLIPTLQKILSYDFPEKWPEFLGITLQLLNMSDANSVFAGLQCLLAICKVYRYKAMDNRTEFEEIVAVTFPQLLNIGNRLVGETSIEAGEMLRNVVKSYKHAIYVSTNQRVAHSSLAYREPVSPAEPPSRIWRNGWVVYVIPDRGQQGSSSKCSPGRP